MIQKHEFQADYDIIIQMLNDVIESQRGEIDRAHQGDEQLRRDQQLLLEQLLEQIRDLREAHEKSLKVQQSIQFRFSKLVEDRNTILELTSKIQELQMKLIV